MIGKQGRTAAALRTLAATAGEREGKKVTLEIRETGESRIADCRFDDSIRQSAILQSAMLKWDEMAVVGRIARPHGIRGQVIVNPETDFPEERFQPGAELFIERGGEVEALRLTTVRFHRERPVIGIEGVETMDAAATLAGRELRVPVERLAPLPTDTFYRHDLIGCLVETRDGRDGRRGRPTSKGR